MNILFPWQIFPNTLFWGCQSHLFFVVSVMLTLTQTICWHTGSAGNADRVGRAHLAGSERLKCPLASRCPLSSPCYGPRGLPLIPLNAAPEGVS